MGRARRSPGRAGTQRLRLRTNGSSLLAISGTPTGATVTVDARVAGISEPVEGEDVREPREYSSAIHRDGDLWRVDCDGIARHWQVETVAGRNGIDVIVSSDEGTWVLHRENVVRSAADDDGAGDGTLTSPMPGTVIALSAAEGDRSRPAPRSWSSHEDGAHAPRPHRRRRGVPRCRRAQVSTEVPGHGRPRRRLTQHPSTPAPHRTSAHTPRSTIMTDVNTADLPNEYREPSPSSASSPTRSSPVAYEHDRNHTFPHDVVTMGEWPVRPALLRGVRRHGRRLPSLGIALEELAKVDQSVAITLEAGVGLGASPIYHFGNEEQKQKWLPDLTAGKALAGFGLTEPDAGSDAGATRTVAREDGDDFIINGSKQFITNSGTDITSLVTVTAVTGQKENGEGDSTIIVLSGSEGFVADGYDRSAGTPPTPTR